jgi:hypothetical protein
LQNEQKLNNFFVCYLICNLYFNCSQYETPLFGPCEVYSCEPKPDPAPGPSPPGPSPPGPSPPGPSPPGPSPPGPTPPSPSPPGPSPSNQIILLYSVYGLAAFSILLLLLIGIILIKKRKFVHNLKFF